MKSSALVFNDSPRVPLLGRDADWNAREGMFHFHSGSYRRALDFLISASDSYLTDERLADAIELLTTVLRIYAELERFDEIGHLEAFLVNTLATAQDVSSSLRSRVHYMLGLCNSYRRETVDKAFSHFEQAIDFAVIEADRRSLAYPILGLATLHWSLGRNGDANQQLSKLDTILECVEVPELRASSLILQGLMLRNDGQWDTALQRLWDAYRLLRKFPNINLYAHVLHALGSAHARKGEIEFARHYLELAKNAIDPSDLPRMSRLIESSLKGLPASIQRAPDESDFDFRIKSIDGSIWDRDGRPLPIQGRFVLRDLAILLMTSPGRMVSKEEIVRVVWNETYDPSAHDNKIYVTIRRLRSLLEASSRTRRSPFILRSKSGYYFDPSAKVVKVD